MADGAGVHIYPNGEVNQQLGNFAYLRELLTKAGVPRTEPMFATEVGRGLTGPFDLTELERAERYRRVAEGLPRSNCNVAMMDAQAWTTSHRGPVWDFAGSSIRSAPSSTPRRSPSATRRRWYSATADAPSRGCRTR